jgi:hypothetical protein
MARIVSASDLDWTIAYLNRLTDKSPIRQVRISREQFEKPSCLSRADAAAALLDIAENATLARTAVNVAGP